MSYFIDYVGVAVNTVRQLTGDDGLALGILTISSMGLVLGLQRANAVVVPPLANTLLGDLYKKAEQWFQDNQKTKFKGFRLQTAVVAVIFGFACYVWTKFALSVPRHWFLSAMLLGLLALMFSAQAIRVSPNIHLRAFFRYFYLPAASGIALGLVSVGLDFFVGLLAMAVATLPLL